jgi:hypothetical protein
LLITGPVTPPAGQLRREIAEVEERLLTLKEKLSSLTSPQPAARRKASQRRPLGG